MEDPSILIYSNHASTRLRYTLGLIFHDILNVGFKLSNDFEVFKGHHAAKVNYSELVDPAAISIRPASLLSELGFSEQNLIFGNWKELPVFFETDKNASIPNDIFSVIFYLVTRYEEYQNPSDVDRYGRFKAEASIAYENNFLEKPLVNLIVLKFAEQITEQFPDFKFELTKYHYKPTFDVDMAYSYLAKGFWRNAGGFIRSLFKLEFGKIKERYRVLLGFIPDPFNNFDFIIESLRTENYQAVFFMNLGDYGKNDKNVPYRNPRFFRLLLTLKENAQLNIHPSYASNENIELLKDEIAKLQHIVGGEVFRSRQHFLIINWPETYQNLIQQGIMEDYSLGYASQVGFRASICTPFKFYNLIKEEETNLLIRPFAFMDGTLTDYMNLKKDEILQRMVALSISVKEVGGDLIGIWHNSSLAEDVDLKDVYLKSLSILK